MGLLGVIISGLLSVYGYKNRTDWNYTSPENMEALEESFNEKREKPKGKECCITTSYVFYWIYIGFSVLFSFARLMSLFSHQGIL